MQTYENKSQKILGKTNILNLFLTIKKADKNRMSMYPKPTGKWMSYQANMGDNAKISMETFENIPPLIFVVKRIVSYDEEDDISIYQNICLLYFFAILTAISSIKGDFNRNTIRLRYRNSFLKCSNSGNFPHSLIALSRLLNGSLKTYRLFIAFDTCIT